MSYRPEVTGNHNLDQAFRQAFDMLDWLKNRTVTGGTGNNNNGATGISVGFSSAATGSSNWGFVGWLDGDVVTNATQGAPAIVAVGSGTVTLDEMVVSFGSPPTSANAGFMLQYSINNGTSWLSALNSAILVAPGEVYNNSTDFISGLALTSYNWLRVICTAASGSNVRVAVRGTIS